MSGVITHDVAKADSHRDKGMKVAERSYNFEILLLEHFKVLKFYH